MSVVRILTTVVCLLLFGCSKNNADTVDPAVATNAAAEAGSDAPADQSNGVVNRPIGKLDGAWVLSGLWTGFMGVAIQFEGDQFKYWFFSDVIDGSEPEYPVSGTWKWDGPVLQLHSDASLYDNRWYVYRYNGELCLLPDSALQWQLDDGEEHGDRLLFKIPTFDPTHPFATRRK